MCSIPHGHQKAFSHLSVPTALFSFKYELYGTGKAHFSCVLTHVSSPCFHFSEEDERPSDLIWSDLWNHDDPFVVGSMCASKYVKMCLGGDGSTRRSNTARGWQFSLPPSSSWASGGSDSLLLTSSSAILFLYCDSTSATAVLPRWDANHKTHFEVNIQREHL